MPVARQIHAQVLPEVDQLQRRADGVGLAQRQRVADPVQVQQQPSHRIGRARAIVQQLRAVGIAGVAHILLEGVEQGMQPLRRQVMLADRLRQRREHCRPVSAVGSAVEHGLQVGAVRRQLSSSLRGGCVAFVGQVVGAACKSVQRHHGRAQRGRAQQRCDGKVFVVLLGHARIVHGRAGHESCNAVVRQPIHCARTSAGAILLTSQSLHSRETGRV